MKTFHPLSFVLGIVSGILVLFIAVGGLRLVRPAAEPGFAGNRGGMQQRAGGGQNLSRIAEQLGMTETDLRKELTSGKNLRDIAAEKGVKLELGPRIPLRQGSEGQGRGGSGSVMTSSGSSTSNPTK